jgi:hypothetical protein
MSNIIKAEIKRLVDLVNDQTNEILQYPDGIPLIELDLVKESLRRLYQHVNYLSSGYNMPTQEEEKALIENEEAVLDDTDLQAEALMDEADQQVHQMDLEDLIDEVEAEAQMKAEKEMEEPSEPAKPVLKEEPKEDTIDLSINAIEKEIEEAVEEVSQIEEETTEAVEEAPQAKEEILEEIKEEPKAVEVAEAKEPKVEKKAPKEDMLLVDQIGKTTIKSLKTAIGINDKFQFINELFDGSMPKYNSFIKELDDASDMTHAAAEMEKMQLELKWENDNPAYNMLQDYVARRF